MCVLMLVCVRGCLRHLPSVVVFRERVGAVARPVEHVLVHYEGRVWPWPVHLSNIDMMYTQL